MNPLSSIPSLSQFSIPNPTTLPSVPSMPADLTSQPPPTDGSASTAAAFTQSLTDAIGSLSGAQNNADAAVAGIADNNGTDIHTAMIAMDQASLSMQLAVQLRDKGVEAYQTLLNMQM
ncbi:MAG: flagellar hook-basal body complex protein FliE [Chloroflexota bacterium]